MKENVLDKLTVLSIFSHLQMDFDLQMEIIVLKQNLSNSIQEEVEDALHSINYLYDKNIVSRNKSAQSHVAYH